MLESQSTYGAQNRSSRRPDGPDSSHIRSARKNRQLLLALVGVLLLAEPMQAQQPRRYDYKVARRRMVDNEIIAAGVSDRRVIESMMQTDRHEFVLPKYRRMAYFDMALPIGGDQTISSPFIVAYMTESLDPQLTDKVLEIGTGSGFQAAILSPLVEKVYTIEIVDSLGRKAARLLKKLNYDNVHVKVGDGFKGWPEHAPFDKIIVTCSPEDVPVPLVEQLREGGKMVIPTGERYQQTLYLFTKKDGKLIKEALRPTLFVPMTGAAEEARDVLPDPANPLVVNGDFSDPSEKDTIVPGWYYGRQLKLVKSASGQHVEFSNADPGRGSHLLQGLGVDGRKVSRLKFSTRAKTRDVRASNEDMLPAVMMTFYDESRRDVGRHWLGPWRGTNDWRNYEKTIRVPSAAREAIIRIGLFGATGSASFDDVQIGQP